FVRVNPVDGTIVTGFRYAAGEVQTIFQIFQGSGIRLSVVAEAETSISSNLKRSSGPKLDRAIEGDAKQIAALSEEGGVNYSKRRGWINYDHGERACPEPSRRVG